MPSYFCPDCMKKFAKRSTWIAHMKKCTAPKAK